MERNSTFETVKDTIEDLTGIPKEDIQENSKFDEDMGFDSLDFVELTMELEKQFDTIIPDEPALNAKTVGEYVDVILKAKEDE